jgi:hypothetical protein
MLCNTGGKNGELTSSGRGTRAETDHGQLGGHSQSTSLEIVSKSWTPSTYNQRREMSDSKVVEEKEVEARLIPDWRSTQIQHSCRRSVTETYGSRLLT